MQISVGSLSPTINWRELARQEFAVPPLDEQRRIAEILWAADSSIERWELCISEAEKLQRTALAKLVLKGIGHTKFQNSPVGHIPSGWQVARIGKVGEVQLGRQRAPQYQTGKHSRPYLRVANVFDGYLDLSDVLEMDFDDQDFERYALKEGDILLNEGQSRELVGRSCMYRGEIEGCCFQNTLIRFRASDRLLPEYAHGYFRLAFYSGVFAKVARQTTSIAHLGAGRFAKLPMPVPSMPEQWDIVNQLEVLNGAVCDLEQHLAVLSSLKKKLIDELLGQQFLR
jgi:type I restriction enzyme S subunit